MAKFYGSIGYADSVESEPGIWEETITVRQYYGELVYNSSANQNADKTIDDVNIINKISIVADPYAYNNFYRMKYVEYLGVKWKIKNVEVQYPRLILQTGGVYND